MFHPIPRSVSQWGLLPQCKVLIFIALLCICRDAMASTPPVEASDTSEVVVESFEPVLVMDSVECPADLMPHQAPDIDLQFRPTQLIVPLSLMAVGTAGCYWGSFKKFKVKVRDEMARWRGDHSIKIDEWLQYVPVAAYLGLGFYKDKRKLDFRERIAVGLTSYIFMTAMVNVAKYSFKEQRPHSTIKNSFPSGHTATAFAGAELIRREFGWGIGSAAYVVATGVAFLRMYNGRHWVNDVIAGAGIGILSAHIGYWMLPLYRKWFHWGHGSQGAGTVIVPAYNGNDFTLNLMYTF